MGVLYDLCANPKHKKRCTMCGCIMFNHSDCDICECCIHDMNEGKDDE